VIHQAGLVALHLVLGRFYHFQLVHHVFDETLDDFSVGVGFIERPNHPSCLLEVYHMLPKVPNGA
jgi:hypothetical protein